MKHVNVAEEMRFRRAEWGYKKIYTSKSMCGTWKIVADAEKWKCMVLSEYNGGKKLCLPTERHSHTIEGKSGQYLGHSTHTGRSDRKASTESLLRFTQFPSCNGRTAVHALQPVLTHYPRGDHQAYLHLLRGNPPLHLLAILYRKIP
jgi:hypothetical protein